MIQNTGFFDVKQTIVSPISTNVRGALARYTPQMSSGVNQNYYNNTLDPKDLTMIKNFSNQMSTLYGHASKAGNNENAMPEQIEKNTKEFVDKFNETVDFFSKNKEKNSTLNRLHESLTTIGKTYHSSLSNIGITVEESGKLSIDENKLKENLSSNIDQVKDTLSNLSSKTKVFAMRGINTSSQSLLAQSNNKFPSTLDEETYNAAIRKMASNTQFMKIYYSSQTAFNMINMVNLLV